MSYNTVQNRFTKHFVKRRNPAYKHARFNQRLQPQGETVDSFVTALPTLAEHCQYGELWNQMIRDHLNVRLLDANASEKLQLEPDLKLEDAIAQASNNEVVKPQKFTVQGMATSSMYTPMVIDALHYRSANKQTHYKKSVRSARTVRTPCQGRNLATIHLLTSVDGSGECRIFKRGFTETEKPGGKLL